MTLLTQAEEFARQNARVIIAALLVLIVIQCVIIYDLLEALETVFRRKSIYDYILDDAWERGYVRGVQDTNEKTPAEAGVSEDRWNDRDAWEKGYLQGVREAYEKANEKTPAEAGVSEDSWNDRVV